MKKIVKKVVAIVLSVTMICTLAGCSKNPKTTDTLKGDLPEVGEETANSSDEKNLYGFDKPITIKIGLSHPSDFSYAGDDNSTNNAWMNLYRANNINPEILYEVDSSQATTKLSTAIVSGNYPDIIAAGPSDYVSYAASGLVADITDVFEEYASDELKAYLSVDGGVAMNSAMIDGRLYGIPKMGNGYDGVDLMFIRQDWLDKLGLEVPTSMEELAAVAHAFTYEDPDGNGKDDTYGMALNGADVFSWMGGIQAFFQGYGAIPGSSGNNFTFIENNGKVIWGGSLATEMKAGLTALQEMYKDGSIPKDFITMNADTIFEEAGAGRGGIWFGPMWAGMVASSNAIKNDPNAHIVSAEVPDGMGDGSSTAYFTSSVETYYSVSSQCENPEVIIKLMNLSIDKLCSPENEDEFNLYYGLPTVSTGWKASITQTLPPLKNYDNYLLESKALETGDTSKLNIEQLNDYNNMRSYLDISAKVGYDPEDTLVQTGVALYTVFGDPNGSYAALDKMIQEDSFNRSAYGALPTEKMSENFATLNKLALETIIKIIVGDDVNTYDSFLDTWYKLGGTEVTAEAQAWHDSNK